MTSDCLPHQASIAKLEEVIAELEAQLLVDEAKAAAAHRSRVWAVS